MIPLVWSLASCHGGEGCLEGDLSKWCTHESYADAPSGDAECGEPPFDPDYQCGQFDVVYKSFGFSSETHFFDHDSGEHVATRFTTDVNQSCGEFESWYGRRVDCEPSCAYDDAYQDALPPCG